jgi:hypothetical protein
MMAELTWGEVRRMYLKVGIDIDVPGLYVKENGSFRKMNPEEEAGCNGPVEWLLDR